VEKRFFSESLRRAALAQAFFNLRGFGKFAGSFVSARLFAQQLGFEDQIGLESLIGLERRVQTFAVDSLYLLLIH